MTTTAPKNPPAAIRNRNVTTELPVGTDANGRQVVASIHSYHDLVRGTLTSVLSRVTIKPSRTSGLNFCEYHPMGSVRIITEPTSRYSDKALAGLHEQALATVSRLRAEASNDKVNAIFAS